jgi:hypothetical protein
VRRLLILVLFAAVTVASCAGAEPAADTGVGPAMTGSTEPGSTEADTTVAAANPTTTAGEEGVTTTSSAAEAPETTSGRPPAPDFTLQLGNGGTYALSQGSKPVYLVFWAEW